MLASKFLSGELLSSITFFPYEHKGNCRLFTPKLHWDTIYSATAPITFARSDVREYILDFYHFQQFALTRIAISSRLHTRPKVLKCIDKNLWKSYLLEKKQEFLKLSCTPECSTWNEQLYLAVNVKIQTNAEDRTLSFDMRK